jgi:hypothetical protein
MKSFHFLQSEKPFTRYFTFAILVFLVSFLFTAPSNKAGNNVYYAIVALLAVPALALLFYRRANLVLCRPEVFLWGGLVVWAILRLDRQRSAHAISEARFLYRSVSAGRRAWSRKTIIRAKIQHWFKKYRSMMDWLERPLLRKMLEQV